MNDIQILDVDIFYVCAFLHTYLYMKPININILLIILYEVSLNLSFILSHKYFII